MIMLLMISRANLITKMETITPRNLTALSNLMTPRGSLNIPPTTTMVLSQKRRRKALHLTAPLQLTN